MKALVFIFVFILFVAVLLGVAAVMIRRENSTIFAFFKNNEARLGWVAVKRLGRADLREICDMPIRGIEQAIAFSPCAMQETDGATHYLLGFKKPPFGTNNLTGHYLYAFHSSNLRFASVYITRKQYVSIFPMLPGTRVEHGASSDFFDKWVVYAEDSRDSDSVLQRIEQLLPRLDEFDQIAIGEHWCVVSGVRPRSMASLEGFWRQGRDFSDRLLSAM